MDFEQKIIETGFALKFEWAEIKLEGPDAKDYLHRQSTNNLNNLKSNQFQLNSFLGADGKIESFFINLIKDQVVHLYTPKELLTETLKRIEKYQIIEEFNISHLENQSLYFHFTTKRVEQSFFGSFWGVSSFLTLTEQKAISVLDKNEQKLFLDIIGYDHDLIGKLLTSTLLTDFALDQKKGCYPGQEPVSKILNNRGAAYYPALLQLDKNKKVNHQNLTYGDRTVFKVQASINYSDQSYLLGTLLRDFRINNKDVVFDDSLNAIVKLFPFFSLNKNEYLEKVFQQATKLSLNKNYAQAKEMLKIILKIEPEHEDALEIMGVISANQNNFKEAIQWMKKLSEANPDSIMAQTNMSLYYMKLGDIETAEKHKEEATFLSFKSMKPQVDQIKEEQERKLTMFNKVLEIDPEDTMANLGIGQILLEQNSPLEAKSYLEKVIRVDGKYSQAYLYLGKALMALKEYSEAKSIFQKGVPIAASKGELMPANEMETLLRSLS